MHDDFVSIMTNKLNEVLRETVDENENLVNNSFNDILSLFSLKESISSSRIRTPFSLCLTENLIDLQASFMLALGGYYKDAFALLRFALEFSLRGACLIVKKKRSMSDLDEERRDLLATVGPHIAPSLCLEFNQLRIDMNKYVHSWSENLGLVSILVEKLPGWKKESL